MLGDLGKLIVAKGFKKLPKVQKNRQIWSHWAQVMFKPSTAFHLCNLGRVIRTHRWWLNLNVDPLVLDVTAHPGHPVHFHSREVPLLERVPPVAQWSSHPPHYPAVGGFNSFRTSTGSNWLCRVRFDVNVTPPLAAQSTKLNKSEFADTLNNWRKCSISCPLLKNKKR